MKAAVKHIIVVGMGAWLALVAGSSVARAQLTGGSVSASGGTPNPTYLVASGLPISTPLAAWITSSPSPQGYCNLNPPSWSWSLDGSPPGQVYIQNGNLQDATLVSTFMSPGTYTVSATVIATWTDSCGNKASASASTGPIPFTAVGVKNLQYNQPGTGYVDVSGTLYVLVGSSVNFQAVPTPDGSSFPSNQPVWSGTSGASGTGPTTSVTFNTLSSSLSDYQTVTATCGNTYATASVTVYDLTPTLTPEDNYSGRDLNNYGVCEYIDLNFQTTPSGITASEIGGLQWQQTSGSGTLMDNGDGTGIYQCAAVADTVTLTLMITGGPCLGALAAAPARAVVPPTGGLVVQYPDSTVFHVQNTCSVGFAGRVYLTGMMVSFREINMREGTCDATATGYYNTLGLNGDTHETGAWASVGALVNGKGFLVGGNDAWDEIASPYQKPKVTPYAIGTFVWEIPWQYKKIGAADNTATKFATIKHNSTCDATGKASIDKGGSPTFSANAGDATSGYGIGGN